MCKHLGGVMKIFPHLDIDMWVRGGCGQVLKVVAV